MKNKKILSVLKLIILFFTSLNAMECEQPSQSKEEGEGALVVAIQKGKRSAKELDATRPTKKQETGIQQFFPLEELPAEIISKIGEFSFSLGDKSPDAIADSYRKFIRFSGVNRNLRDILTKQYFLTLKTNLNDEDFSKLNKYVVDVIRANSTKNPPAKREISNTYLILDLLIKLKNVDTSRNLLILATIAKLPQIVTLLLDAKIYNINSSTGYLRPPLHLAAGNQDIEMAKILLGYGADINSQDAINKETPLITGLLSMNATSKMANFLIDSGANVNKKSSYGTALLVAAGEKLKSVHGTALLVPSDQKLKSVVEKLLDKNVDVNVRDNQTHKTPLMLAAENGQFNIVKKLVAKKAYLKTRDIQGQTAREIAESRGYQEIAAFLKEAEKLSKF